MVEKKLTERDLETKEWAEVIEDKEFTFKRPTALDIIAIGRHTVRLLGAEKDTVTDETRVTAGIIATLKVGIVSSPEGFSVDTCPDLGFVREVFNRYSEKLEFFRNGDQEDKPGQGDGDTGGGGEAV